MTEFQSTTSAWSTLHIDSVALDAPPQEEITLAPGDTVEVTGEAAGEAPTTSACGPGPQHVYYFQTCQEDPGGLLEISACGSAAAVSLGYASGSGLSEACLAPPDPCAAAGTLRVMLAPGPGLHVVRVQGTEAGVAAGYTVRLTRR